MKASIVMAAFVIVCALGFGLRAQAQQDAPSEHSMTGCLAKGSGDIPFRLTNLERGPSTVDIAESTANMDPHVGHKVEITGTAVPGKETHTMKVTAMKHISGTCP